MANTAQAKKRVRQAEKNRQHNVTLKSRLRTHIKKVVNAIAEKNVVSAKEAYQQALPVIDSMVGKGIIHKNKAARHKERLSQQIKHLDVKAAA